MFVYLLTLAYVGARLARDDGDAVFQEPRRLFREQALLPQPCGAMRWPTAQCLRAAIVVNGAPEINVHREAA